VLTRRLLSPAGTPMVGDPLDSKAAEAVISAAVAGSGRVDGVVNCVGSIVLKSAHTTSDADFDQVRVAQIRMAAASHQLRLAYVCVQEPAMCESLPVGAVLHACQVLRTNLYSSFNVLRPAVKAMMKSGGGSIAFCSSAVAQHGIPNHEAIAAAKAGIMGERAGPANSSSTSSDAVHMQLFAACTHVTADQCVRPCNAGIALCEHCCCRPDAVRGSHVRAQEHSRQLRRARAHAHRARRAHHLQPSSAQGQ
jgi:hypothetical protein